MDTATVISLEDWRRERDEHDPAERLERAVEELDQILQMLPPRRLTSPEIERELLAITGAVSIGLIEDATGRADRLRERLERQARKGG